MKMRMDDILYLFDDLFASAGGDTNGLADCNHIGFRRVAVSHDGGSVLTMVAFHIG